MTRPSRSDREAREAIAVSRPLTAATPEDGQTVSIVFPALNEEAAIASCVDRALEALEHAGLRGEVVVVDNGSLDRTAEIARRRGARVVTEARRGYGAACRRGLEDAHGEFVLLLDADATYPVEMVGEFVRAMRDGGADMVLGNRFGGLMERGSMPLLNRYIGNPFLSGMTRLLFRASLTDIFCGMRAIRRDRVRALGLFMPGMEFATEMVVKALDLGMRVAEVSISYRPRLGLSKLRPFRDAWRDVEYMLVFSPSLLLLWPGMVFFLLGTGLQVLLLSGPRMLLFRTWDVHTNLAGLAAALGGSTLLVLGVVATTFAWSIGLRFRHSPVARAVARGGDRPVRIAAVLLVLAGMAMWIAVVGRWVASGFGALAAVPYLSLATTFFASGLELLVASFLVHVIRLRATAHSPAL